MDNPARILLVEDDMMSAFYMTLQLKRMGFQVHTSFASGEEAVVCTAKERPDLILMDINLAGEMTGIEAVRHIRERFDIPVIFVTACSDPDIREQASELKPLAFLMKPVDGSALRDCLSAVFPDSRDAGAGYLCDDLSEGSRSLESPRPQDMMLQESGSPC